MGWEREFRTTPFWWPALCEMARAGEYSRLMEYLTSPDFNIYSTAIEAVSRVPDAASHFLPTIVEKLRQLCEQVKEETVQGPIWVSTFVMAARNLSVAQGESLIAPWVDGAGDVPVAILDIAHRAVASSPLYPRIVHKATRSNDQVRQYCAVLAGVEDRGRGVVHDLHESPKTTSRALSVAWRAVRADSDTACYDTIARQIIMNPEFQAHPSLVANTALWVPTVVARNFDDFLAYYWESSASNEGVIGLASALGHAVRTDLSLYSRVEALVGTARSPEEIERAVDLIRCCHQVTPRLCKKLLEWYDRAEPDVRCRIQLMAGIVTVRDQP